MDRQPANLQQARFTRLVQAHQTRLLRLCCVLLRDEEDARDVVQETFIKSWQHMGELREQEREINWLTRIAVNGCRDVQRSRWRRHTNRRVTPDMLPIADPAASLQHTELLWALLQLPEKQREVVMLYYYQQMNMADIAEVLGMAQSSVSRQLEEARGKLRTELERRCPLHG